MDTNDNFGPTEYLAALEGADPSILDAEPVDQPEAPESEDTQPSPAEAAPEPSDTIPNLLENKDVPGGNAKGAFDYYRNEIAQLKAQIAQQQAQQAQQHQQAQEQQFRAQLEELALTDPEAAAALVAQREQQYQQHLASSYEAQMLQAKAQMSVELTKAAHPDFDAVVGAFMQTPAAQALNMAHFDAQPNPAKALYDYVKSQQPVDREALKRELLAELQPQLQAQQPKAPRTVGSLPKSGAPVENPSTKAANALNLPLGSDQFESTWKSLLEQAEG